MPCPASAKMTKAHGLEATRNDEVSSRRPRAAAEEPTVPYLTPAGAGGFAGGMSLQLPEVLGHGSLSSWRCCAGSFTISLPLIAKVSPCCHHFGIQSRKSYIQQEVLHVS